MRSAPAAPTSPRPNSRGDLSGIGLALLSAAASGTLGVWGKLALTLQLSTPTLLSWRFGLTALLLLALGSFRVPGRERLILLLLGLLYAATTAAYFTALTRISASTSALLVYVAPAFVILYGALSRTRPTRGQLGALACTLLGLSVVIGLPGAADRDVFGLLLGGLSGALYGAYLFASDRLAVRSSPLTVTAHVTLVSAVTFAAMGALGGNLGVPASLPQWGLVTLMVLIPTLVALPALAGAVQRIGAARVSLLASTDPLWAVLFATVFLGEVLGGAQVLGGLLILAGAACAQRPSRSARVRPLQLTSPARTAAECSDPRGS
ncbi:DMT family transporter [Deinococcus hopiensis]|uniref:Threonine/homoserine efflux transporter RhtA n=1 Tax=Deinococcus hopiensis KR-140 TaxID=695939 RepID=A0A1W1UN60_9DEIO|nr:DMT family transporter [Deinococcus hopiensis]SMB82527.1 Threonine/homoserine efflux transporter RhtA [Deinococcus hopiensis KR-140]